MGVLHFGTDHHKGFPRRLGPAGAVSKSSRRPLPGGVLAAWSLQAAPRRLGPTGSSGGPWRPWCDCSREGRPGHRTGGGAGRRQGSARTAGGAALKRHTRGLSAGPEASSRTLPGDRERPRAQRSRAGGRLCYCSPHARRRRRRRRAAATPDGLVEKGGRGRTGTDSQDGTRRCTPSARIVPSRRPAQGPGGPGVGPGHRPRVGSGRRPTPRHEFGRAASGTAAAGPERAGMWVEWAVIGRRGSAGRRTRM